MTVHQLVWRGACTTLGLFSAPHQEHHSNSTARIPAKHWDYSTCTLVALRLSLVWWGACTTTPMELSSILADSSNVLRVTTDDNVPNLLDGGEASSLTPKAWYTMMLT
jgi:hypothetical protein